MKESKAWQVIGDAFLRTYLGEDTEEDKKLIRGFGICWCLNDIAVMERLPYDIMHKKICEDLYLAGFNREDHFCPIQRHNNYKPKHSLWRAIYCYSQKSMIDLGIE